MIAGAQGGLPISYAKKLSPRIRINEDDIVKSDMNGMHSKIGFITNCSSTDYAMQVLYDKDSKEYKELIRRSKLFRYFQGENIDKAKNGGAKEMPKQWFNYQKITDDTPPDKIEQIKFYNSLLIEKRPYFFRYIYRHYNKRYLKEQEYLSNLNEEERRNFIDKRKSFFIDSASVMNNICHYMESRIKENKQTIKNTDFDWSILVGTDIDNKKIQKMLGLLDTYKKYKSKSVGFSDGLEDYESLDIFTEQLRNMAMGEISSNEKELASLAVYCTYFLKKAKREVAWRLFGDGIVQNLLDKNVDRKYYIPIMDESGNKEYLWSKYFIKEFYIAEEPSADISE
jgi:hypothetical protein